MHLYDYCNLFVIICIVSYSIGVSQQEIPNKLNVEKLPFCGHSELSNQRRLLLVSTLDGKLSALNVDDGGSELWNVQTRPGAMLSSSIHRLELTNNGQWVRMIPSLSGGLYKFNGEFIEPIPVTADNLLRSSFRYSDDLVISGGKESRTYGLERETGRLLYECEMAGCENHTGLEATGEILLLQRLTQTVRAVEPRTGLERWNFSVAQHDVKLETDPRSGCYNYDSKSTPDFQFKVIVPEGLVCAISKAQPGRILWTHKFDAPVVSAWKLAQGQVEDVDLFGGNQPTLDLREEDPLPSSPALYVGMHQKQLYIQESVSMQHKLNLLTSSFKQHLMADERIYPQIPWHPVPVTSTAVGLPNPDPQQLATDSTNEDSNETTALSVLYASEYVNGNGFYLYMKSDNKHNETICLTNEIEHTEEDKDKEVPVIDSPDKIVVVPQIFVTSLWFWWKEVFLISVTTAVIVNILIQRRLGSYHFPTSQISFVKHMLAVQERAQLSSVDLAQNTTAPSVSSLSSRSSESFESRFLSDFVPVHCLGKGGFGVVFEARNKIDDCHYAVKRIPLPNSEESRERVMREVKALAKLDHQNIVRYFNAWMECPPPGWQETQDELWKVTRDVMSTNGEAFTVDLTGHVTPDSERSVGHVINRLKPQSIFPVPNWLSQSEAFPSKVQPAEEDDSFIVFRSPSRDVSTAVFETNGDIEEIEVKDDKVDSAITMASDTSSIDTNTDITDVDKSYSPKRPTKLKLKCEYGHKDTLTSSTMYLFIQMQLCMKKSLKDWLKDNTQIRCRSEVLNIFDQIVQAVEYVHMQGLIHRDLKPSNIFFSPDMQVKVGDFGLVTAMAESPMEMWVSVGEELDGWADDRHTARVGTQLYMSPEQVTGKPYSYKVDIYSLGVILFELLVPFNTQMERVHALTNLRANKYPPDFQSKFKEEYDLLKLMLSHYPEERPTTLGIRARPPLNCDSANSPTSEWQFELPSRRRSSNSVSKASSHSSSLES